MTPQQRQHWAGVMELGVLLAAGLIGLVAGAWAVALALWWLL